MHIHATPCRVDSCMATSVGVQREVNSNHTDKNAGVVLQRAQVIEGSLLMLAPSYIAACLMVDVTA
jgi:hypothetical protein